MFELFERGGIMMYPLILSSLIALAYIIERALALRKSRVLTPEITFMIESFSSLEDIDKTRAVCEKHGGPLGRIVRLSLDNAHLPRNELRELLEDQGRQEIRVLERGLVALETIAAIAPLMGLLGTVLGMVRVFSVIREQGIGQMAALSGGISEALLTTVTGLFIAIPVLIAYYYFSSKSEGLVLDIENNSNMLINKINRLNHKTE